MNVHKPSFLIILAVLGLVFTQSVQAQINRPGTNTPQQGQQRTQPGQQGEFDPTMQPMFPLNQPALVERVNPESYAVGPGDEFLINIIATRPMALTLKVGPAGDLLIPGFGSVDTNGLMLSEVQEQAEAVVRQQVRDGVVHVSLIGLRRFKVFVYGAVVQPGYYDVFAIDRLQDVIEEAQLRQLALSFDIQITRENGEVINADLMSYRFGGSTENNPVMQMGDRVYVPFGTFDENAVLLSGAINTFGYRIIRENETLGELFNRTIEIRGQADLENVFITRLQPDGTQRLININITEFDQLVLHPRDQIQFLAEKQVAVHGYVGAPGSFSYIPGYTAGEYITLAGGLLPVGTLRNLKVTREDGTVLYGESVRIERGDVIEVRQSLRGFLVGDTSVLAIVTSTASIVLSAYAILRN